MDKLLATSLTWPDFTDQRLLIVGMGGGCDIISAYAIAQLLEGMKARQIVYANTKRGDDSRLEHLSTYVRRVSDWHPTPADLQQSYSTSIIEHSLPRGDCGCPLVLLAPRRVSERHLADEIRNLGFDWILGVDTGGDSLTDSAISGSEGRDKRMLRVLEAVGLPFLQIVVGPGSDGESTHAALAESMTALAGQGTFLGCFSLEEVIPLMDRASAYLSTDRTARIIAAAADDRLEKVDKGLVIVPRGIRPHIPRAWLLHAFAFAPLREVGLDQAPTHKASHLSSHA